MTATQLKAERLEMGLSQSELADALGIPSNTLARWETGAMGISQPTILSLALAEVKRRVGTGRTAPRAGRPRKATS